MGQPSLFSRLADATTHYSVKPVDHFVDSSKRRLFQNFGHYWRGLRAGNAQYLMIEPVKQAFLAFLHDARAERVLLTLIDGRPVFEQ